MAGQASVAQVLAGTGPILLDFDGPVCSIFAGHPAAAIATELRTRLTAEGVKVPPAIARQPDPLEVLRWTAEQGHDPLTRQIEDALRAAELAAAATASPTPFARDVVLAAHATHRQVAIVSNNSAPAILGYLASHRLTDYIGPVIGRSHAEPAKMKPHPDPIMRALDILDAEPATAVMVGDSTSDILGAQAAGTRSIGYANKPAKARSLIVSGADTIAHSMADIARALLKMRTTS